MEVVEGGFLQEPLMMLNLCTLNPRSNGSSPGSPSFSDKLLFCSQVSLQCSCDAPPQLVFTCGSELDEKGLSDVLHWGQLHSSQEKMWGI